MQTNRVCKTCGKEYYFCSSCKKTLNSPQWMLLWHDENCKFVYEIVSDYAQNHISKEVARERLNKCNLKVEYTFTEKIRKYIDEIMTIPKVEKETTNKISKNNESVELQKNPRKRSQRGKRY